LIDDLRWERFEKKIAGLEEILELMKNRNNQGNFNLDDFQDFSSWPAEWLERVFLDMKYAGYIEKENRIAAKLAKMELVKIPSDMDYVSITGLSAEAKEKLLAVKPVTVGQAARIPGIRQGDIALLMILMRK
jgi:tRNA uridine 5-carboxymethylaminomethyl modification enzyme